MRKNTSVLIALFVAAVASPYVLASTASKEAAPKISKSDPLYSQKMAVWEAEKALHAAQKARPSKSENITAAEKKLDEAQKALLDAEKSGHAASTPAATPAK